MKIGEVEFDIEELLSSKPPEVFHRNLFARKDCDCEDCTNIIKSDAYYMWADKEQIEDVEQLAAAVAEFNWGWHGRN